MLWKRLQLCHPLFLFLVAVVLVLLVLVLNYIYKLYEHFSLVCLLQLGADTVFRLLSAAMICVFLLLFLAVTRFSPAHYPLLESHFFSLTGILLFPSSLCISFFPSLFPSMSDCILDSVYLQFYVVQTVDLRLQWFSYCN